jgi:tetratricopeptide (TPR) repeat protein
LISVAAVVQSAWREKWGLLLLRYEAPFAAARLLFFFGEIVLLVTVSRLHGFLVSAIVALGLLCGHESPAQQSGDFQSLQRSATQAQEAGNNEQAIADYKSALAIHPDWAEGLWALGNLDYNLDRYAEAVDALTRLSSLAPNSGAALSMLGLSEFESGAYLDALTHLQKAHDLNNADDPAITRIADYHLALLLNRGSEFDRAAALLHATFPQQDPPVQAKAALGIALLHIPLLPHEIDPSQDALLQAAGEAAAVAAQGDAQKSEEALASLVAQYPRTPWLHAAYAHALEAAGKAQQAATARREETKLAQKGIADIYRVHGGASAAASDSDATWQQAMKDYSSGNYSQAIAALKLWVQRKPEDGTAWAVMGLSEFEVKDYDNALIHLQRGRQLGVGASRQASSFAIFHLALLLNRSGSFEAATAMLATIADYTPMTADVQLALGLSLLRMPLLPADVPTSQRPLITGAGEIAALLLASKYDAAFPLFQKLIARFPGTPYLHYAYGTALESLSQYEEAKKQMQEEARISPQSALPWIRIASISLKQRLPAEALPAAESAERLAPDSADAHYVLGRASLELDDTTRAIPELEKAVGMAPDSPEPHFALARAYSKAHMSDKAATERAAFARLNALAEQQRASNGSQNYQGPRQAANSSVLGTANSGTAAAPQQ